MNVDKEDNLKVGVKSTALQSGDSKKERVSGFETACIGSLVLSDLMLILEAMLHIFNGYLWPIHGKFGMLTYHLKLIVTESAGLCYLCKM
ncbi:4-hydroxybenzoate geranyltransferase 1 isoform X2 [Daucus carota subsp. sativus]|uniref:4-hydroxybenzoate geranyltransferase 1 isoform X2 n=1 Tax=Daucus carota subsp. sativus TaxID=79200 RepID=UPI0007EFA76A|nr:PREDICTED: 4-hydroxybenzoate geranyltransferase 1-like isoform X2 [Daucus carota subsp. sativus]